MERVLPPGATVRGMSVGPRIALFAALTIALLAAPATAGQTAADLTGGETTIAASGATLDVTRTSVDATQAQVATDQANLTIVVDLKSNGDARWTVSTSFSLTSPAEETAFEETADAFENGETSALGLPAYRRASALASEATGREMEITDVERRSSTDLALENGTGHLTLAFTWTNFGQTNDSRLEIGDAFETEQGTWLSGLEDGDRLVIRAPDGYGIVDSTVAPQNRSLQWEGPQRFNASRLSAAFTGQAGPSTTPTPDERTEGSTPWLPIFGVVVGGGIVAVYLFTRQSGKIDLPGTTADDAGDAATSDEPVETADGETVDAQTTDAETADGTGEHPEAETTVAGTAESADESATDEDDESGEGEEGTRLDEELLSDEERVERLLEENGGRMKQANIVKETGWSNAKVSQLLSSMEDENRIDKLRIGRENLISFPDEEVTDLDE
jgi:uncharacterized membrane protein